MATETTGLEGLAARYASALYDLAEEAKSLDQVAEDLRGLSAAIDAVPDFRAMMRNPTLSRSVQGKAIGAVLKSLGLSDLVVRFVAVVAANRRLMVLPGMIRAFLQQLAHGRGEIMAEVTSAKPLSQAQADAVLAALRGSLGPKITLVQKVDESLIGGLVVQVGSRLVDNSLKSKLTRLQLAMKGVA